MSDRLIRDLRVPKMNSSLTMAEAADEIERLRSLITTFVAVDLGEVDCKCEYRECVCEDDAYNAARDALRQAVGR